MRRRRERTPPAVSQFASTAGRPINQPAISCIRHQETGWKKRESVNVTFDGYVRRRETTIVAKFDRKFAAVAPPLPSAPNPRREFPRREDGTGLCGKNYASKSAPSFSSSVQISASKLRRVWKLCGDADRQGIATRFATAEYNRGASNSNKRIYDTGRERVMAGNGRGQVCGCVYRVRLPLIYLIFG